MTTLLTALTACVETHPTRRVGLDTLWGAAHQADPRLAGDPNARIMLAETLDVLAANGTIGLPKTAAGWDRRATPPLPTWVLRAQPDRPVPAVVPALRVWPAQLASAARLACRADEFDLLDRIRLWLRDHPDAGSVPIEERSLELLGDEKALGRLTGTRLFTSGALTQDLLACHPTPLPFASQFVPGAGRVTLLIVENAATWHSTITAARQLPERQRPALHIAWGHGNQIQTSITTTSLLDPPPDALRYFGDLDIAGLRAALGAATAASAAGYPPLLPAAPMYRALLEVGVAAPDDSHRGAVDLKPLLTWLPTDLRGPAARLLSSRQRHAQEAVGLDVLIARPAILANLGSGVAS